MTHTKEHRGTETVLLCGDVVIAAVPGEGNFNVERCPVCGEQVETTGVIYDS